MLQPYKLDDWSIEAEDLAGDFIKKSKIEDLFGNLEETNTKLVAGYNVGLTFTNRPWYFVICWNVFYPKMGICVKFSAHAYAAYKQAFCAKYQTKINIVGFLQMVQYPFRYSTRCSRIDLVADYKNYPNPFNILDYLHPNVIYNSLLDGQFVIENCDGKKTIKTYSAFDRDGAYETFYAGSKKGKTNGFLRCYDKRNEQIETHGFRYDEAISCDSWVRFEAVFRGTYAHQITEQLLFNNITTDAELQQLIAKHITDKYRFIDAATGEATDFSDDLLAIASGAKVAALSSPSARDNSLLQSISYLKNSSGLYSTFFKVYAIWGQDGERKLLKHLIKVYNDDFKNIASQKDDIWIWLNKHSEELKNEKVEVFFHKPFSKL